MNNFKFCILTNIIDVILDTKLSVKYLTITLFSGPWPKRPPSPSPQLAKPQNVIVCRVKSFHTVAQVKPDLYHVRHDHVDLLF